MSVATRGVTEFCHMPITFDRPTAARWNYTISRAHRFNNSIERVLKTDARTCNWSIFALPLYGDALAAIWGPPWLHLRRKLLQTTIYEYSILQQVAHVLLDIMRVLAQNHNHVYYVLLHETYCNLLSVTKFNRPITLGGDNSGTTVSRRRASLGEDLMAEVRRQKGRGTEESARTAQGRDIFSVIHLWRK